MPRSRKTTGQYTGFGGSDDGLYGSQNSDRNDNRYMNNDRSYSGAGYSNTGYGRDNNSYNNDQGFGSSGVDTRYNSGHDDIRGSRYGRDNGGHDDILGSRYGRESARNRQGQFDRQDGRQGQFGSNSGSEREGHWLDRSALQRNRDYGSDDRNYSNRYGRGMYANPEEKYDDEAEDIRDVRMDSTYGGNYDEIETAGEEDIQDIDSNYENLYKGEGYKAEGRDYDRSTGWSGGAGRNYDVDDYRR